MDGEILAFKLAGIMSCANECHLGNIFKTEVRSSVDTRL